MGKRLLDLEDVSVHYGRLAALQGISVSVDDGEIVCIVGPNGAGKSTTLLTISSVFTPTQGKISFAGEEFNNLAPERVARSGIAHVPEGRHIFSTLSVEENLKIGTVFRKDKQEVQRELKQIYDVFPVLADRAQQSAGKLSGGEQQMLVIGRALLTNPKLMMLDEPSLGLAPKIVDEVYRIITDLRERRGLSLLVVEQSADRALNAADRMYVLRSGIIQLHGKTEQLSQGDNLHNAYFGFSDQGNKKDLD